MRPVLAPMPFCGGRLALREEELREEESIVLMNRASCGERYGKSVGNIQLRIHDDAVIRPYITARLPGPTVSVVPRNVLLGRLTAAPVGSLAAAVHIDVQRQTSVTKVENAPVVHRNALTTPISQSPASRSLELQQRCANGTNVNDGQRMGITQLRASKIMPAPSAYARPHSLPARSHYRSHAHLGPPSAHTHTPPYGRVDVAPIRPSTRPHKKARALRSCRQPVVVANNVVTTRGLRGVLHVYEVYIYISCLHMSMGVYGGTIIFLMWGTTRNAKIGKSATCTDIVVGGTNHGQDTTQSVFLGGIAQLTFMDLPKYPLE
ncbi:hypothetical protein BD779DRAFT_1474075 [Infundibulicybe gibba]|nr:hypothetical protein BD779DRAFT_1474075 [Infundibulicybe gibba]